MTRYPLFFGVVNLNGDYTHKARKAGTCFSDMGTTPGYSGIDVTSRAHAYTVFECAVSAQDLAEVDAIVAIFCSPIDFF